MVDHFKSDLWSTFTAIDEQKSIFATDWNMFVTYLCIQDREVTIILYLNDESWDSTGNNTMTDNGVLKCYLNTEIQDMTGMLVVQCAI